MKIFSRLRFFCQGAACEMRVLLRSEESQGCTLCGAQGFPHAALEKRVFGFLRRSCGRGSGFWFCACRSSTRCERQVAAQQLRPGGSRPSGACIQHRAVAGPAGKASEGVATSCLISCCGSPCWARPAPSLRGGAEPPPPPRACLMLHTRPRLPDATSRPTTPPYPTRKAPIWQATAPQCAACRPLPSAAHCPPPTMHLTDQGTLAAQTPKVNF